MMNEIISTGNKDTRSGFGEGLRLLGEKNPNVVALCADLTGSLKMDAFQKNHPDRFFQIGIAEANMMGIAAGMTIGGKYPLQEPLRISLPLGYMIKLDRVLLILRKMLKSAHHMRV